MGINEKLLNIQNELNIPKNLFNTFGNYYYRNAETIKEHMKPICKKYNVTLITEDDLVQIGERYYIKATATLIDNETGETTRTKAFAREAESKKGMDSAQLTGSTSSYAQKYALQNLLLIDDNKDPDSNESHIEQQNRQKQYQQHQSKNDQNNEFLQNKAQVLDELKKLAEKSGTNYKDLESFVWNKASQNVGKELGPEITKDNIQYFAGGVKLLINEYNKKMQSLTN